MSNQQETSDETVVNTNLSQTIELKPALSTIKEEKEVTPRVAPVPPTTLRRQVDIQVDPAMITDPEIPNPNQLVAQNVFNTVIKSIEGKPITNQNIIEIIALTMQVVQTTKRGSQFLTNEEKKTIVMNVVRKIVRESPMDAEVRTYLADVFIPVLLPGVIDSLCNLNVHDIGEAFCPCLPCFSKKQ